jgi:DNA topoisomerase-2
MDKTYSCFKIIFSKHFVRKLKKGYIEEKLNVIQIQMKGKSIEEKYKKLTDSEHILLRPGMYISSTKPTTGNKWLIENDKMILREVNYVSGFLKLFDEIIMNSIDESKREGSKLNTIKVSIKENEISVWDNGGIVVAKHKEQNMWVPEMIFSETKAGSNFDETDERTWSGTNGIGSVCVNIFSKEFKVTTCDGKNTFHQVFSNNMSERTQPVIKKGKINATQISYLPDYERFGMTNLDETHFKLIQKRVFDVAGCNPKLKVYFNDEEIKIKSFEDYVKFYEEEFYHETNSDSSWSISITSSDSGFKQVSFVNSTETFDGGNHVDYVLNQIITLLREFFQKKHKVDVKPSEIKNHIAIYLDTTIINPMFSSQTKEKLITEVKDFGYQFIPSEKLIKWVLKSEIVNSILDWIQRKKDADESKLARELNKNLSKLKVEKLIDAKGKDRKKCSISIFEGLSAASAFRKYRDTQTQGAFSLRGKFINAAEISIQKLTQNEEVLNLMASIGLKFGQKLDLDKLRYNKILIYADQDFDGFSIAALLMNFFYKFWPEIIESGFLYKVETPIVVVKNKKSKKKTSFYTQKEYNDWLQKIDPKGFEIEYKKGLAALVDDEYSEIIQNPILTKITIDDISKESLNIWFGKDSELRKKELLK